MVNILRKLIILALWTATLQGQTDKARTVPIRRVLIRTCSTDEIHEWNEERTALLSQLKGLLNLTVELKRQNKANIALAKKINEAYKKLAYQINNGKATR